MKVQDLIDLTHEIDFMLLNDFRNCIKYEDLQLVDTIVNKVAHRWFLLATDGYVGVTGVTLTFDEATCDDVCFPCQAEEYKEIQAIKYIPVNNVKL